MITRNVKYSTVMPGSSYLMLGKTISFFIKGDAREVRLVVHTGGEENRAIIIVKLPYLVHICVYLQVTLNTDKTAIKRSSNSFAAILYRW